MTCRSCDALRANIVEHQIELDRERRINNRHTGLASLVSLLLDEQGISDRDKLRMLRSQAQHCRDAAQLTLDERTGRKRSA